MSNATLYIVGFLGVWAMAVWYDHQTEHQAGADAARIEQTAANANASGAAGLMATRDDDVR
jgi:hypothetical protein